MSFCKLERPAPLTQELSSKRKEPQRVCGGQTSVTVTRDDQSHISTSSIHINIIFITKPAEWSCQGHAQWSCQQMRAAAKALGPYITTMVCGILGQSVA